HHVEHVGKSVVGLTNEVSDRTLPAAGQECAFAEVEQYVGHPSLAHLVIESRGDDVVAFNGRTVGADKEFGHMNKEMPFVPAGAPGSLASTRWTMFSVRSWS